jgi:hypothetical protein
MSNTAHREWLMQVLLGPHVSEKATALAEGSNQVVFKVRTDATKSDIRQAVELQDQTFRSTRRYAFRMEEGLCASSAGPRHQLRGRRVLRRAGQDRGTT